jgi:hypothetical protein
MSELDDRIRQSLDRRAASLSERPDLDALNDRIARRDRRRMRATSIALVMALVAGPLVGFLAGRSGTGGVAQSDVATGSDDGVTLEQSGSLPTITFGSPGGGTGAMDANADTGLAAVSGASVPLAKAFNREVDGATVRVFRAAVEEQPFDGPSWQQPPAYCVTSGYVQADVSTDDAVGIAANSLYAELRDGRVAGSYSAIGVAEGAPLWVVIAQAPGGAASVRATFPGGHTDAMEPIDGVAVLVAPAAIDAGDTTAELTADIQLEALDADGGSLGTSTASFSASWLTYLSGELPDAVVAPGQSLADCYPTQQLPPPGEEQPADPAAARAEIEGLFGIPFSERTDEERVADIDDPTGMLEMYERLRNSSFASDVAGSRTVLEDVVFLSATRAATRYHTELPGRSINNEYGEVVFVDGRWKVTRASVCQAVSLAGVSC